MAKYIKSSQRSPNDYLFFNDDQFFIDNMDMAKSILYSMVTGIYGSWNFGIHFSN